MCKVHAHLCDRTLVPTELRFYSGSSEQKLVWMQAAWGASTVLRQPQPPRCCSPALPRSSGASRVQESALAAGAGQV